MRKFLGPRVALKLATNNVAMIPIINNTTSSSISVKPSCWRIVHDACWCLFLFMVSTSIVPNSPVPINQAQYTEHTNAKFDHRRVWTRSHQQPEKCRMELDSS